MNWSSLPITQWAEEASWVIEPQPVILMVTRYVVIDEVLESYAVQSAQKIITPRTTHRARAHPAFRTRHLTSYVAPLIFIARAEGHLARAQCRCLGRIRN